MSILTKSYLIGCVPIGVPDSFVYSVREKEAHHPSLIAEGGLM